MKSGTSVGRHAVAALDLRRVDQFASPHAGFQVEHPDPVAHALEQVAIARQKQGVPARVDLGVGERLEQVVGFQRVMADGAPAERREQRRGLLPLPDELVRDGWTVGVIAGIQLHPVGSRVRTEAEDDRTGVVVGHDLQHHVDRAQQGIDGSLPLVGDRLGKREEGAVEHRRRIDHEQRLAQNNPSAVVISARMLVSIISRAASARCSWICATASRGTVTRKCLTYASSAL